MQSRRRWFNASIGLDFDGEQETLFLTDVKGANLVGRCGSIVTSTHWLGSLFAELRESVLKRDYPSELAYGPPTRDGRPPDRLRPVGPLGLYQIENGRIKTLSFHATGALGGTMGAEAPDQVVEEPALAVAALRPIWFSIDPVQDRNFRWPFHGEYVLTGGPGTGKTSVALLRIRFLLEQQREPAMAALLPPGVESLSEDFFTEPDMLIVVWERHLEPYLQESLRALHCGDVPVQHYDRWLNDLLRRMVPLGPQYKLRKDSDPRAEFKARLTEIELDEWIASWGKDDESFAHPLIREAYRQLTNWIETVRREYGLAGGPSDTSESWEVFRFPLDRTDFRYNEQGLQEALQHFRYELVALQQRCGPAQSDEVSSPGGRKRARIREAIPGLIKDIERLFVEIGDGLPHRYPRLLTDFYLWESERQLRYGRLSPSDQEGFSSYARKRLSQRLLSRTDRDLLLWLACLISERADRVDAWSEGFPSYCHLMVDEAQQYDPLILRLFRRLARAPFHSITLVGDLRQRLREDGGIVVWDDLGVPIPPERRCQLFVNYRWAKATFDALQALASALGLNDVELKPPLRWYSGEGIPAGFLQMGEPESELDAVVDRISELRLLPRGDQWSIAIILPETYRVMHLQHVLDVLDSAAINARWAAGGDIRAGREGVTITNPESVVGLEFDAVFIAGAQHFLPDSPTEVQRQSFWVMATRARMHISVSASEEVPLLEGWHIVRSHTRP